MVCHKTRKSPNWNSRFFLTGPIEGFPFEEGFPATGPADGKVFIVILRDGRRLEATVDFSQQYKADGLCWQTTDGRYGRHVIAAWREKDVDFRIIRVSQDYGVVIAVSPENADLAEGAIHDYTYYLHHEHQQLEGEEFFQEISSSKAFGFFSGVADGLGWNEVPPETFSSLADIEQWVTKSYNAYLDAREDAMFATNNAIIRKAHYEALAETEDSEDARDSLERIQRIVLNQNHETSRALELLEALQNSVAAKSDSGLAQSIAKMISDLQQS